MIAGLSLAASLLMLIGLLATAQGTVDASGRPLGTDFSNVWTAGQMVLDGKADAVWDWPQHLAVQQRAHGRADIPFYPWPYPPPFLLIAAGLAMLPYVLALVAWAVPLFARSGMAATSIPFGWLSLVLILIIALRRATPICAEDEFRSSPSRH